MVFVESLEEKDVLLASDPDVFFTTPHYDGHATVLVNLDSVQADEARELITDSWRLPGAEAAAERVRRPPSGLTICAARALQ